MARSRQKFGVHNPIRLLAGACSLTVAVLAWLGWSIYDSRRADNLAEGRHYRIEVLRGRILHLDEVLTMSARIAAATGDLQWEQRYRRFEPQLDAAIREAMAISPEVYKGEAAKVTHVANIALVEMERRAFDLIRQGRTEDAKLTLFSEEYEDHKKAYAEGMAELETELIRIEAADSRSRARGTVGLIAAVILGLLTTAGGWFVVLRILRKWQALLVESNRHLIAQGKDLTELNATLDQRVAEQTRDLRSAKGAAETANRSKTEFLANMSHEIRTPMTAILGFAENLLDADQPESEKLHCVQTILSNGEYLLGLINDILDLSKIEAGKMTVEDAACRPCPLVAEVASLMRVRADAKGLSFEIDYIGAIPEVIRSDATRLRQILINLIGNAVKFTEHGGIRLVIRLVDAEAEPRLQFDVIDTGYGVTEKQLNKLFQPFVQADASTTREFGGTGLGLSISKRFAELLGGSIAVIKSERGVGTTFRVTIATGPLAGVKMLDDPASATTVADAPSLVKRVAPIDLHGCHVLLAEDNVTNQILVGGILRKAGAEVAIVRNGRLALDAGLASLDAHRPFDCILMDMQMPIMDGYEATTHLRRKGYVGPIVALTANAMDGDCEKCIKAGCDDYATKPIDRTKLIEMIQRYLVPTEAGSPAGS